MDYITLPSLCAYSVSLVFLERSGLEALSSVSQVIILSLVTMLVQYFLIGLLNSLFVNAKLRTRDAAISSSVAGFEGPVTQSFSAGNHGVCVTGKVAVTVSANNTKLLYGEPADQVTERFLKDLSRYVSPGTMGLLALMLAIL